MTWHFPSNLFIQRWYRSYWRVLQEKSNSVAQWPALIYHWFEWSNQITKWREPYSSFHFVLNRIINYSEPVNRSGLSSLPPVWDPMTKRRSADDSLLSFIHIFVQRMDNFIQKTVGGVQIAQGYPEIATLQSQLWKTQYLLWESCHKLNS